MFKTMINPLLEQVVDTYRDFIGIANKGARTRIVHPPIPNSTHLGIAFGWSSPNGIYQAGGYGVPNSYRQVAMTTVAGVVWAQDKSGNRHVCVLADRLIAPKSTYGQRSCYAFCPETYLMDGRLTHMECVYPRFKIGLPKSKRLVRHKVELAIIDACRENPLDPANWAALADWYQDNAVWMKERSLYPEVSEEKLALVLELSHRIQQEAAEATPCPV